MHPARHPCLVIVCGLPGSGKTTHALRQQASRGGVRLCPDEWMETLAVSIHDEAFRARIERLQWDLAQQLLAQGLTVIVEWGTWAREERDLLREGARALGVGVELHYLTAPVDVLVDRIARRGRENPPISADDVHEWARVFQSPTPLEAALFDDYVVEG